MYLIICLLGVILLLQKLLFEKRQKYEQALLLVILLTGMGLCVIRIDCLSFLLNYEFLLAVFFAYNNSSRIRVGKYCSCFSDRHFCIRRRTLRTRYYVYDQLILYGLLVLSLVFTDCIFAIYVIICLKPMKKSHQTF
jgi:hypothetical protein